MIRHIVLLQFHANTSSVEQANCMTGFAELPNLIGGITHFEHGVNTSPEGLAKGYTHVAIVTFSDAAARDVYLKHPAHLAFVARLKPQLADVLVFDIEI
jgi:hypothetical protein